jgi:toxin ParE1/3/4
MVKWTDHAKAQPRHIHDYIAQDSARYAKRVTEAVRETSLYSYRILYEVKTTHIDVLAVIHKRRDLQPEEISREQ